MAYPTNAQEQTAGRQAGGIVDEPATARALAGFLLRGLDCGALTDAGFGRDELRSLARS